MTLASLATLTSRQSTLVANNTTGTTRNYGATIYLRISSGGTAPAAGNVYEAYLIRADAASSPTYLSDNAGASDAAITIENAQMLGVIVVTATANKNFYGEFHTGSSGPLGFQWGIAVRNGTGQSLHATEGNHYKAYAMDTQEIQ